MHYEKSDQEWCYKTMLMYMQNIHGKKGRKRYAKIKKNKRSNTSNALLYILSLSPLLFDTSPFDSHSEWSLSLWFSPLPRKQSSSYGKSEVKSSASVGPAASICGHKSTKASRGGKWIANSVQVNSETKRIASKIPDFF